MCFMFVYWGIGIHLCYLMFERAMIPNPSGIAIPHVDVDAMRQALPWPDKVFRTIELLPQYQAALNTWDDMPFLRHDEISSGVQCLVDKPSEIPLWATFGITLFLDIQTTLGKKQSQPFHELQTHFVDWQQRISPDRGNTTTHFKRDIEMAMKGAFTFDRNYNRPESEAEFTADRDLMYQTHELLFKHLYASAQVDTFRLHGIHNDPHARSTTSTTSANLATPFEKESFYFLQPHPCAAAS
jgi:hypothetical protein